MWDKRRKKPNRGETKWSEGKKETEKNNRSVTRRG